ncbi:hypothetical protein [Patulibacter americanus]|uniref:hypothetical protein n=1 Tax=Patulibacter americanus TaxID=588672 RepID=UPI0003B44E9D|nr:hypothetical protein [Patulibacter americanus]
MLPSRLPPSLPVFAAAIVAGATLGASPAAASPEAGAAIPTLWSGWTALGPITTAEQVTVGAGGATFAIEGTRFATSVPAGGGLVGSFPGRLRDPSNPAVVPGGRIAVLTYPSGAPAVATSADLGGQWRTAPLPARAAGALGPFFTDDARGIVVERQTPPYPSESELPAGPRTGPGVWATEDGGRTWTTVVRPEALPATAADARAAGPRAAPEPPDPLPRVSVTAVVPAPGGAFVRALAIRRAAPGDEGTGVAVERSVDGGRTWSRLATRPSPGDWDLRTVTSLGVLASGEIVAPLSGPFGTDPAAEGTLVVLAPEGRIVREVRVPGRSPVVSCGTTGGCMVGAEDPSGARVWRDFDGASLGPRRPPSPEVSASDTSQTFDDHRTVVRIAAGAWSTSRDGMTWTTVPTPPSTDGPLAVATAPGGLVALLGDDTVWRLHGRRWTRLATVSRLADTVAWAGRDVLVAGEQGIDRIRGRTVVREVRGHGAGVAGVSGRTRGLDVAFNHLDVRGSRVLAWQSSSDSPRHQMVRSDDAGRSWRRVRSVAAVDDLQSVSARTIVASHGSTVLVSRDGGRRFRRVGTADGLALERPLDPTPHGAFVAFRTARTGLLGTGDDLFLTRDGGRTFEAVPRPAAETTFARLTRGGVLTDGPLGMLVRGATPKTAQRQTALDLRIVRVRRARNGAVRVAFRGRAQGVPAGEELSIVAARGPSAVPQEILDGASGRTRVSRSGAFRDTVELHAGRWIRVYYRGAFQKTPFRTTSLSGWVRVPTRPQG